MQLLQVIFNAKMLVCIGLGFKASVSACIVDHVAVQLCTGRFA